MINYNKETGNFEFFPFKAHFKRDGEWDMKYTDDKQYWENFIAKWDNHTELSFEDVVPTQAQTDRLNTLNGLQEQPSCPKDIWPAEFSYYVETGEQLPAPEGEESSCPYMQELFPA